MGENYKIVIIGRRPASASGTWRAWQGELTMSAPEGRADGLLGFDRIYEDT